MSNVILAIDPSIVSTGYAVISDGELVFSGVIKPPALSDYERVGHVMQKIWSIATKHPRITAIIIEVPDSFSYARSERNGKALNQGSLQKLNWVIGGLFVLPSVWANAGAIHCVTPRQWKGSRSKHLDQLATGIKQKDEADAVALGLWWVRIGRQIMKRGDGNDSRT